MTIRQRTRRQGFWALAGAAVILAAACGSGTPVATPTPTLLAGAFTDGLIAYAADQGIGVLDPSSGKSTIVAPLPAAGAFGVAGPVWGPAPDLSYPVIYFTIHDLRPAETRTTPGVVPYDWLFRVDPFTGVIAPIAASQDGQSDGPIGLVANSHYIALTVGCCATYEVDALDLTQPTGALNVLSRPPAQAAFFTEGIAPGLSGLIAVREVATGGWYWLNADADVLNPFPLTLHADDGPIAISPDGSMVAVAMLDHGAVIEPINVALPVAAPSASAAATAAPTAPATGSPHPATPTASSPPRLINSKLPHPDGLAWSPDAKQLAIAVNGDLEIYEAASPDGTAPAHKYLAGGNIAGVSWSAPIPGESPGAIKASAGPQPTVDALLDATKLPAGADTPQARPFTKVYVWQFDSSRDSPIASIADATPAVLAKYQPIDAGVVFHHWAPSDAWAFLGGCFRYRVVITGSIPPTPVTVGLTGSALCSSSKPSPTAKPT
ncbi:MAG: hypothetical protein ACREOM_02440 [Candidatus Dormibacteraceae bacterium]